MLLIAPSITKFLFDTSNFFTIFVEVHQQSKVHLCPLQVIDQILESVMIFQSAMNMAHFESKYTHW